MTTSDADQRLRYVPPALKREVVRLSSRHQLSPADVLLLLCSQRVMAQFVLAERGDNNPATVMMGMTPSLGHVPHTRQPGHDVDVIVIRASTVDEAYVYLRSVFDGDHSDGFTFVLRDDTDERNDRYGTIANLPAVFQEVVVSYGGREVASVKLDAATRRWPRTSPPFEVSPYFRSELGHACNTPFPVQSMEDIAGQKIQALMGITPVMQSDDRIVGWNAGDRFKDFRDLLSCATAVPMNANLLGKATAHALAMQGVAAGYSLAKWMEQPGVRARVMSEYEKNPLPGRSFVEAVRIVTSFVDEALRRVHNGPSPQQRLWNPRLTTWEETIRAPLPASQLLLPRPPVNGFIDVRPDRTPCEVPNLPAVRASNQDNVSIVS